MSRPVPRPAAFVAAVAAAVLAAGVSAAGSLPAGAPAAQGVPAAAVAPSPASAPTPAPGPPSAPPAPTALPIQPGGPKPARHPGDPATWTSRQLAAQLVFACVQTRDLSAAARHAAAGVGGIVVMGRPSDGAALGRALASVRRAGAQGIAPMIASDEEGGKVQRLRKVLGPLPSAAEMGRWPDARIEQTARAYATRMRALGYRMALSPVADLAAPGYYVAQTGRGFSADPRRAASAAAAWSRGLQSAGVLSAVKHWPGHGYATDSHKSAPVGPPVGVLRKRDLLPFDAVLRSGARVVMVGHLRSEGLTEPGVPATLSPRALGVLRRQAGPQAVLLTDSLSMAASASALGITPARSAVRALTAGADWAMVCVDAASAVRAVQAALASGEYPWAQAVTSARRILGLKQSLGLLTSPLRSRAPGGALERAELAGGTVRLTGRASDPDGGTTIVRVLVAGQRVRDLPATGGRFTVQVPVAAGQQVCVWALNGAPGAATPLGCASAP